MAVDAVAGVAAYGAQQVFDAVSDFLGIAKPKVNPGINELLPIYEIDKPPRLGSVTTYPVGYSRPSKTLLLMHEALDYWDDILAEMVQKTVQTEGKKHTSE